MGFFDSIKNLKNMVTGGSAKVQLDIEPVKNKEPFNISMRVDVASENLKIEGAYIIIQSIEDIKMPNKDAPKRDEEGNKLPVKTISTQSVTSEQKIEMSEGLELQADEKYHWKAVVKLEDDSQPVYEGKYCKHYYQAKAYVDCFGNDPDSGWINLDVS